MLHSDNVQLPYTVASCPKVHREPAAQSFNLISAVTGKLSSHLTPTISTSNEWTEANSATKLTIKSRCMLLYRRVRPLGMQATAHKSRATMWRSSWLCEAKRNHSKSKALYIFLRIPPFCIRWIANPSVRTYAFNERVTFRHFTLEENFQDPSSHTYDVLRESTMLNLIIQRATPWTTTHLNSLKADVSFYTSLK